MNKSIFLYFNIMSYFKKYLGRGADNLAYELDSGYVLRIQSDGSLSTETKDLYGRLQSVDIKHFNKIRESFDLSDFRQITNSFGGLSLFV